MYFLRKGEKRMPRDVRTGCLLHVTTFVTVIASAEAKRSMAAYDLLAAFLHVA